ncbi:transporter substrate-binding domain-containing protein [Spirillospora sp. NPDC047279]|uniref:transporter substrate-binding domain-containing protein n=1 Tax=Spirillospora sp. NPDC047279 TaxID=3155478 RepID=UPI0033E8AD97
MNPLRRRGALVSALVLALTGCSAPMPAPTSSPSGRPSSPSTAPFGGRKLIFIGQDLDVHAGASGAAPYTAFDKALADYITRRLGIDYRPIVVTPSVREKYLEDGSVDLVIASYVYTPARARRVDFTGTYLVSESAVLVRKENSANLSSRTDLPQSGRGVCTVANSIQSLDTLVRSHTARNDEACVTEVQKGKAFAYYSGLTIVSRMAATDPDLTVVRIPDLGSRTYSSVGIRLKSPDCTRVARLVKDFLRDEWRSDFQTHLKFLVSQDPDFMTTFRPTDTMVDRYTKCSAP